MLEVQSQHTTVTRIARRTRGQNHGPITRLMSPSDFGRLLKPFVFLDLIDNQGKPFTGFGLHPHSGIATLTYVAEGSVRYEDTNGATGLLRAGGLEWMRAGGGVWHGGGAGEPGRTRGFQLWVTLPPELELGPSESVYQAPEVIPHDGPARVLLGSYGTATSAIKTKPRPPRLPPGSTVRSLSCPRRSSSSRSGGDEPDGGEPEPHGPFGPEPHGPPPP